MNFQISVILIVLTAFSEADNFPELCVTIQVSNNFLPVGLGYFHTHSNDNGNIKTYVFAPTLNYELMELDLSGPFSVGNHTVCHKTDLGFSGLSDDAIRSAIQVAALQYTGSNDAVHFRLFIELNELDRRCSAEYYLHRNGQSHDDANYMGFWVDGDNTCDSESDSVIGKCCHYSSSCVLNFRDISCESNQQEQNEAVNCESVSEEIQNFPEITSKAQKHTKMALLKLTKRCEKTNFSAVKQKGFQDLSELKKEVRDQKNTKTELRATEKLQARADKETARQRKQEAKAEQRAE